MVRHSSSRTNELINHEAAEVPWHALSVEDAFKRQQSNVARGLSRSEAALRLANSGANALARTRRRSTAAIFLAQFRSLIVALLAAAALVAIAIGEQTEAIAILTVVAINAAIGFLTEWRAEEALNALRKQAVPVAHVIREGVEHEIPAEELVPGDVIVLAAGARVPADGRICESVRLQIEEAPLTGESQAITKTAESLSERDAAIADRRNMAFLGTTIVDGRGKLLVTATGNRTEVGKIGVLINEAARCSTPLEQKLARLGRLLLGIVSALCVVIVLVGWLRGVTGFWHMLEIGLSLAIAAVPEGLPAVTTMTLALGMQRMARTRALIRRLAAVETLGSVTVICTDKTGTLTKNEMTVCAYAFGPRLVKVAGDSFHCEGLQVDPLADGQLTLALQIGALCNDAKIHRNRSQDAVLGDPTEAALIVVAEKAGIKPDTLALQFSRTAEVPFDSTAKRMVTVHRTTKGALIAFIKGAPATLLSASKNEFNSDGPTALTATNVHRWQETNRTLADAALRVLALAYRELPENYDEEHFNHDLTFVGLVGMSDPLREETNASVEVCRTAGVRTIMITGDQLPTAAAIAKQLGIDRDLNGRPLRIVHGRELTTLNAASWDEIVTEAAVFARVSPEHKLRIVETLQRQGHVVAMTGDGVNDAPALKKANIGIAMGVKGTEVAKESSDMVITDDNFATIVSAIEQGRIIYGNILKFLHYLLSCNFSEILTVFFALIMGWPLPLAPLQILWLNLITDVFPAFALALEPSAPGVMTRPPRSPHEPLLTGRFVGLIVWQGFLLAGVTLLAFAIGIRWHGNAGDGLRQATTMAFTTLAFAQVFHAFNARSRTRSAIADRLFTNGWLWGAVALCIALQSAAVHLPFLQTVLDAIPPETADWVVIVTCSLLPVLTVEAVKILRIRTVWHKQFAMLTASRR